MKTILLGLIAVFSCSCLLYASEPRTFERILQVSGEVDLDVTSGPGGITVRSGPAGSVRVRAVIRPVYGAVDLGLSEASIRALEQNPPVEQSGNRIRVGYVNDPAVLSTVSVTYEILTPRESRARVATHSGGIHVDGIAGPAIAESSSGHVAINGVGGEIAVKNSSGAIVVRASGGRVLARNESGAVQVLGAQGRVQVETTSGRMEISDIRGDVSSRTHSGSIIIDNVAGAIAAINHSGSIDVFHHTGPIRAETKSGAVRITQLSQAPITARTDTGAITVELADGRGYDIDARSESGKVSGPAMEGSKRVTGVHWFKEQVRGGGPLVDLDTRSSKIVID